MATYEDIPLRTKAPADEVYMRIDHAAWLAEIGDDTIATSAWAAYDATWAATDELTLSDATSDTTTATVKVSGGTINGRYFATNHIVTADGQEKDSSIEIHVTRK